MELATREMWVVCENDWPQRVFETPKLAEEYARQRGTGWHVRPVPMQFAQIVLEQ